MLYISLLLALLAVACLIFVPNTVILLSFVAIMHGFAVYSACHALLVNSGAMHRRWNVPGLPPKSQLTAS